MKETQDLIYSKYAEYYDLLYSKEAYGTDLQKDSRQLLRLIKQYKKSKGNDLLDVGCGTARHISYLKKNFSCVGIDISEDMLRIARKNVKGVEFIRREMTKMNLGKKFDVIISMFSSVAHLKNYREWEQAIKRMANHLKPGGVIIIEPWYVNPSLYNTVRLLTYKSDDIKIARIVIPFRKGITTYADMHHLVGDKKKGIFYFVDKQRMIAFDKNKSLSMMKRAGLNARFVKSKISDRGLYIATKSLQSSK